MLAYWFIVAPSRRNLQKNILRAQIFSWRSLKKRVLMKVYIRGAIDPLIQTKQNSNGLSSRHIPVDDRKKYTLSAVPGSTLVIFTCTRRPTMLQTKDTKGRDASKVRKSTTKSSGKVRRACLDLPKIGNPYAISSSMRSVFRSRGITLEQSNFNRIYGSCRMCQKAGEILRLEKTLDDERCRHWFLVKRGA